MVNSLVSAPLVFPNGVAKLCRFINVLILVHVKVSLKSVTLVNAH